MISEAQHGHKLIEALKDEIYQFTNDGESWTEKDKYVEFEYEHPKF